MKFDADTSQFKHWEDKISLKEGQCLYFSTKSEHRVEKLHLQKQNMSLEMNL